MTIYKFLNFLFQKFRNFDCPKGLFCFRFCDNILHSCPVISLIDTKLILFKIDISFCNRKQLPDPASSPEQHLKHKIISCSRLHCLYKLFVLVQCPEVQTSWIWISHSFHFLAWINRQVIDFSCMCKQTGQLILNHSQIRIWIAFFLNFILPLNNLWSLDFTHHLISEVWNDMLLHHISFIFDCSIFQIILFVWKINLNKIAQLHIHTSLIAQLFASFKLQCFSLCFKSTLSAFFLLTHDICLKPLGCPFFCVFFSVSHIDPP